MCRGFAGDEKNIEFYHRAELAGTTKTENSNWFTKGPLIWTAHEFMSFGIEFSIRCSEQTLQEHTYRNLLLSFIFCAQGIQP